jgi:hypothetical protein
MRHESIAVALGITLPTLRKHYEKELSNGALQKRMDVLGALYTAATKKGSSSAAKAYLEHAPAPDGESTEGTGEGSGKMGKKEKAQADARTAQKGTDWDDLLPGGTNVVTLKR